jgi:NAD(P)-dependent dehydrogenase (short-subunit alcohol dehydrogenase family)
MKLKDCVALVTLQRWADPEEVAVAMLFLESDDRSFFTG